MSDRDCRLCNGKGYRLVAHPLRRVADWKRIPCVDCEERARVRAMVGERDGEIERRRR